MRRGKKFYRKKKNFFKFESAVFKRLPFRLRYFNLNLKIFTFFNMDTSLIIFQHDLIAFHYHLKTFFYNIYAFFIFIYNKYNL